MTTAVLLLSFALAEFALPTTRESTCEGILGCNNRGTCAGTQEEGFYCICDLGYFGLRCQLPDDKPVQRAAEAPTTDEIPCQGIFGCNDHGDCTSDNEGGFYCSCNPGWYGVRCQIPTDKVQKPPLERPCDDQIDCNNNGICTGIVDNVQCNCFPGWYGVRCQIPEE